MYLAYKESNHPKWQAVRHIFEDPTDGDSKLRKGDVDAEGSAVTPKADFKLFEGLSTPKNVHEPNSVMDEDLGRDEEAILELGQLLHIHRVAIGTADFEQ